MAGEGTSQILCLCQRPPREGLSVAVGLTAPTHPVSGSCARQGSDLYSLSDSWGMGLFLYVPSQECGRRRRTGMNGKWTWEQLPPWRKAVISIHWSILLPSVTANHKQTQRKEGSVRDPWPFSNPPSDDNFYSPGFLSESTLFWSNEYQHYGICWYGIWKNREKTLSSDHLLTQ